MSAPETVVLVHGLWMRGFVMALMRHRIERCGYRVLSYSYPTIRLSLHENAARLERFCRKQGAVRLHFVGHSLGGIVVLSLLERATALNIGRVVLAGPPFAGSFSARRFARLPGGDKVLGRSIRQWLDQARAADYTRCEIGVIAGSSGIGLGTLIAPDLPRPNDGVVTVDETRVPGARDHIVLGISHTLMLVSAGVVRQICAFLRNGAFSRRMKDEAQEPIARH
jgi:pimeloyl-ACP methyl ester carboxylesterase